VLIASAPIVAACLAKLTDSGRLLWPTCTMTLRDPDRTVVRQRSATWILSAVDKDGPSPVVPQINAPATPSSNKMEACRSMAPRFKEPSGFRAVNVAAMSAFLGRNRFTITLISHRLPSYRDRQRHRTCIIDRQSERGRAHGFPKNGAHSLRK